MRNLGASSDDSKCQTASPMNTVGRMEMSVGSLFRASNASSSSAAARYPASVDVWDGEDLGPGVHEGTYASSRQDGHGRVVESTERVIENNSVRPIYVRTEYLPTGEPVAITRQSGAQSVTRTMQYDTLGRLVPNLELTLGPNGWRYLFERIA